MGLVPRSTTAHDQLGATTRETLEKILLLKFTVYTVKKIGCNKSEITGLKKIQFKYSLNFTSYVVFKIKSL